MIFLALLLPLISLLPLGWLWLLEHGYLPYWLAAALTASVAGYLLQAYALRLSVGDRAAPGQLANEPASEISADPAWTSRERKAWAAVEAIAADVKPEDLGDRDKAIAMGLRVVEAVAREIHPQDRNPLWKFTLPEALALIERICADLRPFVAETIPLGDQLTIGQVLKIYQWRSVINTADKVYDIWRIIRLMNPAAAVAQEAREQLTRRLYTGLRDELARRLAKGYVREVGKASIDLYGGRLRVTQSELRGHISSSTRRDRGEPLVLAEPLRILIAGRTRIGKSGIAEALSNAQGRRIQVGKEGTFELHETTPDGLPPLLLIESVGVYGGDPAVTREHIAKASEADLILWVADASCTDQKADRDGLDAIRRAFPERPDQVEPPLVVVLIYRPPAEAAEKASNGAAPEGDLGETMLAVAEGLDVPLSDVVPLLVRGDEIAAPSRELLASVIADRLPGAQRAQVRRLIADATPRWSVRKLLKQGAKAGWTAARSIIPGRAHP